MNNARLIRLGLYFLIFVNVLLLNVILHEIGHYVIADYYNLDPKIEFSLENIRNFSLNFNSVPLADTSFNDPKNHSSLADVAMAGPIVNLFLGIIFFFIFIFNKKREYLREIMIIAMMVSFASFIMNMLPLSGSDGSLIFRL